MVLDSSEAAHGNLTLSRAVVDIGYANVKIN